MKRTRELYILGLWILLCGVLRVVLLLFPHRYFDDIALLTSGIQLLLFLLVIQIARHGKGSTRHIFLNFAMFFGFILPLFLGAFVGYSLWAGERYAVLYYHTYVNRFGLNGILLATVIFVAVDYFSPRMKTWMKYAASFALAASVVGLLGMRFVIDPHALYREPENVAFEVLSTSNALGPDAHSAPTDDELADHLAATSPFTAWERKDLTNLVGDVKEYLGQEGGESIVFWKPLDKICIYCNLIVVLIIASYLVSLYFTNRPVSAYLDKIMLIMLILSVLEIVHYTGFIYATSFEAYRSLFTIGQYFTLLVMLVMVYAVELKLRFVLSVTGRYYEDVLARSPGRITRWIDEIDALIARKFFNTDVRSGTVHRGRIAQLESTPPHSQEKKE